MASVKIYSTPSCTFCKQAKAFFKEHDIAFKEIDVSEDEKGLEEMREKSGQMGVPVIDIDGKILVGFSEDKLSEALKI